MISEENKKATSKSCSENGYRLASSYRSPLTTGEILERIMKTYGTTLWKIQSSHNGVKNMPRLVAIYCLRFLRGLSLKSIARVVKSPSGNTIAQVLYRSRAKIRKDPVAQEIIAELYRHGREKKFRVARSNEQGPVPLATGPSACRG